MIPGNPRHAFALGQIVGEIKRIAPDKVCFVMGSSVVAANDLKTIDVWLDEKCRNKTYKTVHGAAAFILKRAIRKGLV